MWCMRDWKTRKNAVYCYKRIKNSVSDHIFCHSWAILTGTLDWHSCGTLKLQCGCCSLPHFYLLSLSAFLSASTLWLSQLCIICLSPPSLPVPMLLSLCLSRLSLSLFQRFANHFSLSLLHHEHDWTNCPLLLPVWFFQALLQMVQLLIVHLYRSITALIALDLYCILKYIVFLN